MIRINLLPGARKKAASRRLPSLGGRRIWLALGGLLLVVGGEGALWYGNRLQIQDLQARIQQARQELGRLQSQVREVKDYEDKLQAFQERVALIRRLEQLQKGPVHMLEAISRTLPDGVWLTSLEQKPGLFSLRGNALTNQALVQYVEALKREAEVLSVELQESRQVTISQVPVYQFRLSIALRKETG